MESPNSSTGQENEADQQSNELPISSEKDKSQENSDHVPLPSPSQQEFQPILKALTGLEHDDPKFAFPAARHVGLYRRLWESCVSKHVDGQMLEQDSLVLKEAGAHLRKER